MTSPVALLEFRDAVLKPSPEQPAPLAKYQYFYREASLFCFEKSIYEIPWNRLESLNL